ncbi:hypothetical protein HHL26_06585 [Sphingobium sp. TB-6]|uniref:hypothetical protein n=1 Tax=Sphingobium sp. TB-6 TaxID=2728850 RepID=UPI00146B4545|nr:hypothetical protein [Sphingobium sp. TB-6]NML88733.1 hypothetical protein [Sphingobium sp. TB-6]
MALPPEITAIFSDSPATALSWAKAILVAQSAAFEAEDNLQASATGNAGISEFGNLRWIIHAQVLDAVAGLIGVAELITKEA